MVQASMARMSIPQPERHGGGKEAWQEVAEGDDVVN
jgi:hypothetical protein